MLQVALVANEHNNDVGVSVVAEFLQPPSDVDVGRMLGDVVDQQSTDGTSVITKGWRRIRELQFTYGIGASGSLMGTYAEVMARYRS